MDYEEKYNRLVEAVKVLQETNPSDEGIQNWVNNNVPELQESEDEKVRKALIEFFESQDDNTTYSLVPKKDILAWLEKQGQKPAEWSEEDEKRVESCLNILQPKTLLGNNVETINTKWLKSLRQRMRWKPTKEQMYFLSWIANVKLSDSIVDQTVSKYLNELYEDLKKL